MKLNYDSVTIDTKRKVALRAKAIGTGGGSGPRLGCHYPVSSLTNPLELAVAVPLDISSAEDTRSFEIDIIICEFLGSRGSAKGEEDYIASQLSIALPSVCLGLLQSGLL